jgi:hypothetical protein
MNQLELARMKYRIDRIDRLHGESTVRNRKYLIHSATEGSNINCTTCGWIKYTGRPCMLRCGNPKASRHRHKVLEYRVCAAYRKLKKKLTKPGIRIIRCL